MKYLKPRKTFENFVFDEIIKSEKFKKWFGDSEMSDKNNNPILFYHGSNYDFDEFDHSKIGSNTDAGWLGKGFYFYTDQNEAQHYGKVKTFLLKIENPYYATEEDNEYLSDMNDLKISEEFTNDLITQGYDGVYYNGNLRGETVVFDKSQIFLLD